MLRHLESGRPGVRDGFGIRPFDVVSGDELSGCWRNFCSQATMIYKLFDVVWLECVNEKKIIKNYGC